jgi:hypothetical protein
VALPGPCDDRAPLAVVPREIGEEHVDPGESHTPAVVARRRSRSGDDLDHCVTVRLEEPLDELDTLVATVSLHLALVRVELHPPEGAVGEERRHALVERRQQRLAKHVGGAAEA